MCGVICGKNVVTLWLYMCAMWRYGGDGGAFPNIGSACAMGPGRPSGATPHK